MPDWQRGPFPCVATRLADGGEERAPLKIVADNRGRGQLRDRRVFEAGIMLTGTEVNRSAWARRRSRNPRHTRNGEIWLVNSNIPEYQQSPPIMRQAAAQASAHPADRQAGAGSSRRHDVVR